MEVRIATFNIYWFPSSPVPGNSRSAADREKVREVIKRLDADVIVFQEILDLAALENLLSGVIPGRSYSLRDEAEQWAASGAGQASGMKVPVAYDRAKLRLLEAGSVRKAGGLQFFGRRDPIAARLQRPGGGQTITVVGVHLKSGLLTWGTMQPNDNDKKRKIEMDELTEWMNSPAPITPGGPERQAGEPTVLIGDFNAVRGNMALQPLTPGGGLAHWSWLGPRFATAMSPSPAAANLPSGELWTTYIDKMIIDHVIVSPEVEVIDGPWVYAFNHDASWRQAAGVSEDWFEEVGTKETPSSGTRWVENLFRVSDHRPVRVSVGLT